MVSLLHFFIAASAWAQSGAPANSVGFAHGNTFTATPIQGQVQVTCSGFNGEGTATYNCRDVALDPQSFDYVVGPVDSTYRWIDLIAILQDGSSRVKSVAYNGSAGRSNDVVNLWVSNLFQKGLLAVGNNEIKYKIYTSDNREPQLTGTFQATVIRGQARQCATGNYDSTDINDCSSQYSICQRYFTERQFCR